MEDLVPKYLPILSVLLVNDLSVVLPNAVLGNNTSHAGGRINVRMAANHSARIADRITADFNIVAQHRAEFSQARLDPRRSEEDRHVRLVGLDVARDRARAHVRAPAQHAVAHVVEVGNLRAVEDHRVFDLGGIADHRALADDRLAADKRAVADLGVFVDDAGAADRRRFGDLRAFRDPDIAFD